MAGRQPVSTAELFELEQPTERCHLCRRPVWSLTVSAEGDHYCRELEDCNRRARDRLHAEQPWRRRLEANRLAGRYG